MGKPARIGAVLALTFFLGYAAASLVRPERAEAGGACLYCTSRGCHSTYAGADDCWVEGSICVEWGDCFYPCC